MPLLFRSVGKVKGMSPIVSAAPSVAGFERDWIDRQIEELCKQVGGIKVCEAVTLSRARREDLAADRETVTPPQYRYGPDNRYAGEHQVVGEDADNMPNTGGVR